MQPSIWSGKWLWLENLAPPKDRAHARTTIAELWTEFTRGLTTPSLSALWTVLAVNVLLLFGCCWTITPELICGSRIFYLQDGRSDDPLMVTRRVFQYRAHPPQQSLTVLMGSSATREGVESEEELQVGIETQLGNSVAIHNLMVFGARGWDMVALADSLRQANRPSVVVIGVSPSLLYKGAEDLERFTKQPRFGFRSAALDQLSQAAGIRNRTKIGIYALDNYAFFLPRAALLPANLWRGPPGYRLHQYRDLPAEFSEQDWQRVIRNNRPWLTDFDRRSGELLDVLTQVIELSKQRGFRVILVENPLNPRWRDTFLGNRFYARYQERVLKFAACNEVRYFDINRRAGLVEEEFYDHMHLQSQAATQRYTQAMAQAISIALKPMEGEKAQ